MLTPMKKNTPLRVSYASAVYGAPEIKAVTNVLKDPSRIVAGYAVKKFERRIAKLFGKRHGIMVNSGSSANLLALELLNLPAGSEVITPVLTFSTTLAPIIQKGLTPVFIDVEEGTYMINVNAVERAITTRTKALMVPSLIGNVPDVARLNRIAKKYRLWYVEDSCDTLGSTYKRKPTGAYTDISTTSFYASHIITAAGSGGMICLHDPALAKRALLISNWGRNSTLFGVHEQSEELKKRFASKLEEEPYDAKFVFSEIGYNFQPTELQAAFGLAQLKRLATFMKKREQNFARLHAFFKRYEHFFVLPKTTPGIKTTWLAFPLTIRKGARFSRHELTHYLERSNIQTRPIFTGNALRQPAFSHLAKDTKTKDAYPVADAIMRNGFLIGCHHGMNNEQIVYLERTFKTFLSRY